MRVESGIVSIVPEKLEGVESDRLQIHRFYIFWNRCRVEPFYSCPFVNATGARTILAQVPDTINRFVTIGPGDSQRGGADLANILRCWVVKNGQVDLRKYLPTVMMVKHIQQVI